MVQEKSTLKNSVNGPYSGHFSTGILPMTTKTNLPEKNEKDFKGLRNPEANMERREKFWTPCWLMRIRSRKDKNFFGKSTIMGMDFFRFWRWGKAFGTFWERPHWWNGTGDGNRQSWNRLIMLRDLQGRRGFRIVSIFRCINSGGCCWHWSSISNFTSPIWKLMTTTTNSSHSQSSNLPLQW